MQENRVFEDGTCHLIIGREMSLAPGNRNALSRWAW